MRAKRLQSAAWLTVTERRSGMSRFALITGSLLWVAVFGVLFVRLKEASQNPDKLPAGGVPSAAVPDPNHDSEAVTISGTDDITTEPVVASTRTIRIGFPTRQIPQFELQECLGGTITRETMLGKRWLANFVFTRCAGPCPLMTRDISELHRQVADANPDFQFVTFSVDPDHDTPEVLKKYAETFQADHDRWKFVTGAEESMHDLIRRAFALYVAPNLGENRRPGFEVAHSNRAVLVNEEGIPVATYLMTVPEDVVKLRRVIDGRDEFPEAGPLLTEEATGQNPPIQFNLLPATGDEESEAEAQPAVPESANADGQNADSEPDSVPDKQESDAADLPSREPESGFRTQQMRRSLPAQRYRLAVLSDESAGEVSGSQAAAEAISAGEGAQTAEADHAAGTADAQSEADSSAAASTASEVGTGSAESGAAADNHTGAVSATETRADRNRKIDQTLPDWVSVLPALNAFLNSCCIVLLTLGLLAIRRSEKRSHQKLMISAFAVSVLFLISYLTYHEVLYRYTGERGRSFVGSSLATWLYYAILIPHVILAAAVPVLALRVFWLAWKQRWEKHRQLARITFPIWMFVSITGVLIYVMLYHWPWSTIAPAVGPEASALRVHLDLQRQIQAGQQTLQA